MSDVTTSPQDVIERGALPVAPPIEEVAVSGDFAVSVLFADGERRDYDVGHLLDLPVFVPLRYGGQMGLASVAPHGRSVEWPCGAEVSGDAIYFRHESDTDPLDPKTRAAIERIASQLLHGPETRSWWARFSSRFRSIFGG